MVTRARQAGLFGFCLIGLGCSVDSKAKGTGGVPDKNTGQCPHGVAVVLTDYVSTQLALSALDGETESASFISTGSTETAGLAFALSGDVVLPTTAPVSGNIVLLDRFGTNVITWVDPESAEVVAQLPVGTGFESNPKDYLEVGDDLAFVPRWGQNAAPGKEPYDAGSDVLVLDTKTPLIVGSIPMPAADGLPPGPSFLTRFDREVVVSLDRLSGDFSNTGEAMFIGVSIDELAVTWQQTLPGLKACGRPTPSPDRKRVVIACTGALTADGAVEDLAQSAILVFDGAKRPFVEVNRFAAADLAGEPVQNGVDFVNDHTVLFKTQTEWGGATNNRLLSLDLETGKTTELLEASPDADGAGKGIVYGGTVCAPGCSSLCLMTDSDQGVLQRVEVGEGGALKVLEPVTVESDVGLPPTGIAFR